jgi:hypothetical protein
MLRVNGRNVRMAMATLVAMLTIGSSFSVLAQRRYDKNYVREIGRRNGFEFGEREGRRDVQSRDRFDYKRSRIYKDAEIGYRNDFGHRGDYRNGFRDGFEAGYRNGYNSYGRGGGWGNRDGGWWGNDRGNDRYGRNDRNDRNDDWYRRRRQY